MTFGEKLKQFRDITGYTQKQAADKFGVKKTTWQMWEEGQRIPKIYSRNGIILMMAEHLQKHNFDKVEKK